MISAASLGGRKIPWARGFRGWEPGLAKAEDPSSFSLRHRSLQLTLLLEGGSGQLSQAINTGKVHSLHEALGLLAREDRAVLTRNSGNQLSLWLSLSQEKDPEIFYQGLLNLAHSLEGQGPAPLAARIYAGLSEGGGRIPSRVSQRAAQELALLREEGPWGQQVFRGLDRGLKEAGNPAFLLGMTAGGIGFRLGRIWGMSRLAAWGVRGPAFSVFSGFSGLTLEAGAFVLTSKGVRSLQGLGGTWAPTPLVQEFGGALLMLGFLRVSGHGANRVNRAIPLAGRVSGAAIQNGGLYLGLVASHYAAMELAWEPRRPWSAVLAGSGAELCSFSLASRVARSLLGRKLGEWERGLEIRGQSLETPWRRNPPSDWSAFPEGLSPWARQGAGRSPRGRGIYPEVPVLLSLNSGRGSGGRSSRPGTEERVQLGSQEELLKWIWGEQGDLRDQILRSMNHMTFHLPGRAGVNLEGIAEELNQLDYLSQLLRGRRIRLAFEDGSAAVDYIKLGNRFLLRDTSFKPPFSAARSNLARPPQNENVSEGPDHPSIRPWAQEQGRFADPQHLPVYLSGYEGLRAFLSVAKARLGRGDYGPLVLQGMHTDVHGLEIQTRGLGKKLPPGVHLELWSTENRQTFVGIREGMILRWRAHRSSLWDLPDPTSGASQLSAGTPLELYLRLYSLSLIPKPDAHSLTTIRYESLAPPPRLKEMVLVILHELSPPGVEIRIVFPGTNPPWRFFQKNNAWVE